MTKENKMIQPSGHCTGSNPLTRPYDTVPLMPYFLLPTGNTVTLQCNGLYIEGDVCYCRYVRKPLNLREIDFASKEVTEKVELEKKGLTIIQPAEDITRPMQPCMIVERQAILGKGQSVNNEQVIDSILKISENKR
jgi:hypothetical protein